MPLAIDRRIQAGGEEAGLEAGDAGLPSGVRGPVLLAASARLAASCSSEMGTGCPFNPQIPWGTGGVYGSVGASVGRKGVIFVDRA